MARRGFISPETIEEIKQRNDIVSTVEGYVKLTKRSSANLFGLCPFHSEDTPSFSVSPSKQIFYCFGCNKGGDVVRFIMDMEKLSYVEALRFLAEKSGVDLSHVDDEKYRQRNEERKILVEINTEAARYFYHNLVDKQVGRAARDYLKLRGISTPLARKFGLGFAPNQFEGLHRHLLSKGYQAADIHKSGLVKKGRKEESSGYTREYVYDLFRGRLIFPIFDQMGRIVAFGGRVIDKDAMPKYINSPETPLYTKGRHLYGFNLAKKSRAGKILIVEGYLDLLAVSKTGIDYVVASLGTALTVQQASLIRNYTTEVIICFDSDIAGAQATMRGLDILKERGCNVKVMNLREAKDPDDFIRDYGVESFLNRVKEALPLLDYKLLLAYENALENGELKKIQYQEEACNILSAEENVVVRELYSMQVAEKLGISPDNILAEAEKRSSGRKGSRTAGSHESRIPLRTDRGLADHQRSIPEKKSQKPGKEEILLLCLLSYDTQVYDRLKDHLDYEDFTEGPMRDLARDSIARAQDLSLTASALISSGNRYSDEDEELVAQLAKGCMTTQGLKNNEEAIREGIRLIGKIRTDRLLKEKNRLTGLLTSGNTTEEEAAVLAQKIKDITDKINLMREYK